MHHVIRLVSFIGLAFLIIPLSRGDDKTTEEIKNWGIVVDPDGKEWAEVKGRGKGVEEIHLTKTVKVGVAATNATTKVFAPVFEGFSLTGK